MGDKFVLQFPHFNFRIQNFSFTRHDVWPSSSRRSWWAGLVPERGPRLRERGIAENRCCGGYDCLHGPAMGVEKGRRLVKERPRLAGSASSTSDEERRTTTRRGEADGAGELPPFIVVCCLLSFFGCRVGSLIANFVAWANLLTLVHLYTLPSLRSLAPSLPRSLARTHTTTPAKKSGRGILF